MDKVIKELKNKDFVYQLGYDLKYNKVYPYIEIYKGRELFSGGCWTYLFTADMFVFIAYFASVPTSGSYFYSMKELFNKLREYSEVPDNIEKEFEDIFLLYKLNNFKEL